MWVGGRFERFEWVRAGQDLICRESVGEVFGNMDVDVPRGTV